MKRIPIDEVKEGMILAKECLDSFGDVLIPAGAALNEVEIERLKIRDILFVEIIPPEIDENEEEAFSSEPLQAQIREAFTPMIHEPHMAALAKAAYRFHKKQADS